jgi:hypothetical protein
MDFRWLADLGCTFEVLDGAVVTYKYKSVRWKDELHRKHHSSAAVQSLHSCLLAELLPSNGYCIVAVFAVVD